MLYGFCVAYGFNKLFIANVWFLNMSTKQDEPKFFGGKITFE